MNSESNSAIAAAMLNALRLRRSDIFGPDDDQCPVSEINDAQVPQVGFVGRTYQRGGDLLLGINPGGGGDSYRRTPEDMVLLPRIRSIHDEADPTQAMRNVFDIYAHNMQTWNLWRIVGPVLQATGSALDQIGYLNFCPFRTRGDKMPRTAEMSRCLTMFFTPLIESLAPQRIIALGKKAGAWLERTSLPGVDVFIVPRTIGDSYLSTEALAELERIRASTCRTRNT